jgi:hypothetical protein
MSKRELIEALLSDPLKLKMKKPFTRGADRGYMPSVKPYASITEKVEAQLPRYRQFPIAQEQYMRELDERCHDVLFDDNIPAFCVKLDDGNFYDVVYKKVALPIQSIIKDKQVLHLTGNPMQFTMMATEPTEQMAKDFITFKQYWDLRNQDGMKRKMVDAQKSYGDAGLLFYHDHDGKIKSRLLSIEQGYVLCPHNDENGDRIVESVYYAVDGVEYIDSYDDTFMTRWTNNAEEDNADELTGWVRHAPVRHGFDEIPLVTKRGKVAWDEVQTAIEGYETLYNIFLVVQKRFGNGILYVRGKFKDQAQKIAGSIVLNDTSLDGNGDAKFLTPPTPQNMIDTMKSQLEAIMLGSKTTFVLPQDIKTGGDISGLAVQLTREMDILNATQAVIEWQNVADKMTRLFKQGLAMELVNSGVNPTAITDFANLDINAKFKVWRPFNEYEFNQMITVLTGAGILSKESGIELNTLSKPDEKQRIKTEEEEAAQKALEQMMLTAEQNEQSEEGENQKKGQEKKEENKKEEDK